MADGSTPSCSREEPYTDWLQAHPGAITKNNSDCLQPLALAKEALCPTFGFSSRTLARSLQIGDLVMELNPELTTFTLFCPRFYRTPPANAQYLLLFHHMPGVGMCINGRKFLGNTPTVIAGPQTNMRFGVVGMGNVDGFIPSTCTVTGGR
jgi:hypothetical protein